MLWSCLPKGTRIVYKHPRQTQFTKFAFFFTFRVGDWKRAKLEIKSKLWFLYVLLKHSSVFANLRWIHMCFCSLVLWT
jgi:hypothetical protein